MTETLVKVENLETTFFTKLGPIKAVDGISFEIAKGKTLGIVGESGCGKSVTSFSIMGLLESPGRVTGGSVRVRDLDLTKSTERQMQDIRGNVVSMIFQEPMTALNPVLKIGYQIDEPIIKHMKLSAVEARERSIEMLHLVGIPSPSDRYLAYPHELSGGMRQRAMIAMALACNPEYLIADEPTTALDVTVQAQILELMRDLQDKFKMSIQLITHDLGVVSEMADNVLVMYAGVACEQGSIDDIFSSPLHPYTRALMNSIPKFGARVKRLPTIPGTVPSPLDLPHGCPFQNRCPNVIEQCRVERPKMMELRPQHFAACYNPQA